MCLGGRHRSARTAFGRLRGIALSDQNHAGILPQPSVPRALSAPGPTATMRAPAPWHENGGSMNWPRPPVANNPFLPPAGPTPVSAPALTTAEARERDIERRLAVSARQRRLAEGARFRAAGKLKAARKAKPRPAEAPSSAEAPPALRKLREVRVSQSVRASSAGLPTLGKRRQEIPQRVCTLAGGELRSCTWKTRVRQGRWASGSPPGRTWRLLRSEFRDTHRPSPSPRTQPQCPRLFVRKTMALRDPLRLQVQRTYLHRCRTAVQAAPAPQGPPYGCGLLVRPAPAGPLRGRVVRDGGTPGAAAAASPSGRSPAAGEFHRRRARARCVGHGGHRAGASSARLALARIGAGMHQS